MYVYLETWTGSLHAAPRVSRCRLIARPLFWARVSSSAGSPRGKLWVGNVCWRRGNASQELGDRKRSSDPPLLHPSNIALETLFLGLVSFLESARSCLFAGLRVIPMLPVVYGLSATCRLCPVAAGLRHSARQTEILFTGCFANREPALISFAGGGGGGGGAKPDFRHPFQTSFVFHLHAGGS